MKSATFESACREVFRGWDGVETFSSYGEQFVTLRISEKRLLAARGREADLINRLFSAAEVEDLARRIVQRQRAQGLRRYGRRRR